MNTEHLSIKENMLWNSFGSAVSLLCNYLISILVVRLSAGFEAAGLYSLAMAVANTVLPIAVFRTRTYQVSDVKNEYSAGEYLTFRFYTCFIAVVLGLISIALMGRYDAMVTIVFFLAYKVATLLIDVFHGVDQKNYRMDYIGKSLTLQGVLSLLIFGLVFLYTHNLNITLLCMTISILFVAVLYDYRKALSLESIVVGIKKEKAIKLFKRCFPLVMAGFAFSIAAAFPREYIASTMGDEVMGAYSSIAMPAAIIQMGATYIYLPLIGYFSKLYSENNIAGIISLFIKAFFGIVFVCFVCLVGVGILGKPVLTFLYGEKILDYMYLLNLLVFYAFITGVMWFLNDLLIAFRSFRPTVIAGAIALVVLLLSIDPCAKAFGLNGVTIASVFSCASCVVFMFISLLVQLKK